MTDPQTAQAGTQTALTIPPDIQERFGPLIELIKGSESMNNEERQYWINILGVMTPEQIKNLEDILQNEKKQLAAIDEKYNKDLSTIAQERTIQDIESDVKRRRSEREKREQHEAQEESEREAALLQKIEQGI